MLKDFAPLNPQGELTVPARPDGAGSCFATSIAVPVAGVYRCLAGNTLLDPCFAPAGSPSPAAVTCFTDPWTAGRTVTLTRPLPPYDPQFTRTSPWALQLGNGARCVVVTGTVPALGSIDLTYTCGPTTMAGITVAADGVMTAHYGPATGPLTDVTVAVAWRGLSHRIG